METGLRLFNQTDGLDVLWQKLHVVLKERLGTTSAFFGFTHSYQSIDRVGASKSLFIKHSYPADYVAKFPEGDFLRGDITTLALYNNLGPHLWADLAALPELTDLQKERERIDDAYGYQAGVSLAFRFAGKNGIAGIGLASRHMGTREFEQRWKSRESEHMVLLAEFEALMRPAMVAERLRLTPREKQCLKLSIGGMSAKEIGHHLGIGERSVFNILNRARKSLEAATTIEAVAKALAYDLI